MGVDMDMVDMDMDMVASKDKCLVGQMPVLAFVHRGICPPGICPSRHLSAPLQGSVWVQAFVRTKCGFRHLSSWHLSDQKLTPGICPPGICPIKNCLNPHPM